MICCWRRRRHRPQRCSTFCHGTSLTSSSCYGWEAKRSPMPLRLWSGPAPPTSMPIYGSSASRTPGGSWQTGLTKPKHWDGQRRIYLDSISRRQSRIHHTSGFPVMIRRDCFGCCEVTLLLLSLRRQPQFRPGAALQSYTESAISRHSVQSVTRCRI
jgi:hypothetical protein